MLGSGITAVSGFVSSSAAEGDSALRGHAGFSRSEGSVQIQITQFPIRWKSES